MSKTYVTTTRLDARDITTICQWMVGRGIEPTSRTSPISTAVEAFARLIRKDAPPPSIHAAYAYLESIGLLTDPRTKRAITKGLQTEALEEFSIPDTYAGSYTCPSHPIADNTNDDDADNDEEALRAAIKRRQLELEKAQAQFSNAGGIDIEEEPTDV